MSEQIEIHDEKAIPTGWLSIFTRFVRVAIPLALGMALVFIVLIPALLGPAIGNVFSNIVSSL